MNLGKQSKPIICPETKGRGTWLFLVPFIFRAGLSWLWHDFFISFTLHLVLWNNRIEREGWERKWACPLLAPKRCDPESTAMTLETLERAKETKGSSSGPCGLWCGRGGDRAGSRMFAVSVAVAVDAKQVQSPEEDWKESHGRLRQIGLPRLLQVRSGKAMNRNSTAGAWIQKSECL